MNCHDVATKKIGPSFKDIAAKYKGKADAEATLVTKLETACGPSRSEGEGRRPELARQVGPVAVGSTRHAIGKEPADAGFFFGAAVIDRRDDRRRARRASRRRRGRAAGRRRNRAARRRRGLLLRLRAVAVAGQVIAIAVAQGLGVGLPLVPMGMIVGGSLAISAWSWLRSRRGAPVTLTEVVVLLAFDLAAFSLLARAGGRDREPVLVALRSARRADRAAAAATPCLRRRAGRRGELRDRLRVLRAAPLRDGRPVPDAVLAVGLWVGFALTALVTAWFVVRIVADLRAHERLLREAARRALNDEAIMRLGALAAGAAHELATPLTTMAVVAGEMAREAQTPAVQRDAAILTGPGRGVPARAVQPHRRRGPPARGGRRARAARRLARVPRDPVPGGATRYSARRRAGTARRRCPRSSPTRRCSRQF